MCVVYRYCRVFQIGGLTKKLGKTVGVVAEKNAELTESRKMGPWVQHTDPHVGKPYYYNKLTNETSWNKPLEVIYYLPPEIRDKFTPDQIAEFKQVRGVERSGEEWRGRGVERREGGEGVERGEERIGEGGGEKNEKQREREVW